MASDSPPGTGSRLRRGGQLQLPRCCGYATRSVWLWTNWCVVWTEESIEGELSFLRARQEKEPVLEEGLQQRARSGRQGQDLSAARANVSGQLNQSAVHDVFNVVSSSAGCRRSLSENRKPSCSLNRWPRNAIDFPRKVTRLFFAPASTAKRSRRVQSGP